MSPHLTAESSIRQHRAWWKEASVYQIYPASFKDSTGSGFGDLKGIVSKIPYIEKMGVDVVWLCPIFESPQVDMGYDISDYRRISPDYGNIGDVDTLMHGLHEKGIKLLLDLVVNHTSDQHQWFKESRSSKSSPYRDWYIWRNPRYDAQGRRQPPNNWKSHFQGSAWEYDEASDEYYLHLFCKEQPDLNWENPSVRDAVHQIMRFWLDRGIDGFRLDVINYISKDQDFPDSDPTEDGLFPGSEHYAAGPRLHEYLKGIGQILREYDAFSVGEMPYVRDPKQVIKSVRHDRGELNMIFNFEHVDIDHGKNGKFSPHTWPLQDLKGIVSKWQKFMHSNGGWNALYLENHDQPRSINRFACSCIEHRERSAKMLAIFLAMQAGTTFIYQGQELGMTNVPREWDMEEYKDVDCLNHWRLCNKATSDPKLLSIVRQEYQKKSRDNARTPMQWDASNNGGFTSSAVVPWMKSHPNHSTLNAEAEMRDSKSAFNCWRSALEARRHYKDIVVYGDFHLVDAEHEKIFAYIRRSEDGQQVLVVCNFSPDTLLWTGNSKKVQQVVLSNCNKILEDFNGTGVSVAPYEAFAVLVAGS